MASLIWATAIYFPTEIAKKQVREVIWATGFWTRNAKMQFIWAEPQLDAI